MAGDHCFFEHEGSRPLARRACAEGVGTMLLVLVVAGTAMALQAGAPGGAGAALLTTAFAASGALVALIVAIGPLSGGHFNPLITLLQWLGQERRTDCTLAYVAAQVLGGLAGAASANALHPAAARVFSGQGLATTQCLSEFVASAGLLLVVQLCSRASARAGGPFAVGAWLGGAIVATPTLSLANPALAAAALVAKGPMALRAADAGQFALIELAGALAAFAIVRLLYPGEASNKADAGSPENMRMTDDKQ